MLTDCAAPASDEELAELDESSTDEEVDDVVEDDMAPTVELRRRKWCPTWVGSGGLEKIGSWIG